MNCELSTAWEKDYTDQFLGINLQSKLPGSVFSFSIYFSVIATEHSREKLRQIYGKIENSTKQLLSKVGIVVFINAYHLCKKDVNRARFKSISL